MTIKIPFEIGQELCGGVKVKSLHIYIDQHGEVANVRTYTGPETGYITLQKKDKG